MGTAAEASLRDTWERTTAPFGASAAIRLRAWDEVGARYAEQGRHYHTLDHITALLATLRMLEAQLAERSALILAAFLHDVIYDTRTADNEERSAAFARDLLRGLGVREPMANETARLIQLTKTHRTERTDQDGRLLLDGDLAVLGAEPTTYDHYAALIRREYGWVPEEEYRSGRLSVLEGLLCRPWIYVTDAMFVRAEDQARNNLRRECDSLRQKSN
jgi:predicted metal-dependent HD superfamily phosphohydrolase